MDPEEQSSELIDSTLDEEEWQLTPVEQEWELTKALIAFFVLLLTRMARSPTPRRALNTAPMNGHVWISEMMRGHEQRSYRSFRLAPRPLLTLVQILENETGLEETRYMTTVEQVCILLHMLGYGGSNRYLQERFQHSGETISRHLHNVITKLLKLEDRYVMLPPTTTPDVIRTSNKWFPYFDVSTQ